LLLKFFNSRKEGLVSRGIQINLSELLEYYQVE